MNKKKNYRVVGIMTGTSVDGIDLSYCINDWLSNFKILNEKFFSYSLLEQASIKKIYDIKITKLDGIITNLIIKYLSKFLNKFKIKNNNVDYLSISYQTVLHQPQKNYTTRKSK